MPYMIYRIEKILLDFLITFSFLTRIHAAIVVDFHHIVYSSFCQISDTCEELRDLA